ncbi:MAG: His/Gly/Thr/Pro-type tRNA ligase C-terminal domain-containing protein, partial [Chloroflexota bacterium]|nr:His/Gly/Thr/Pro-type tRNA ligase C-terminal domain-containing protein [Chloroflexota bacterium]
GVKFNDADLLGLPVRLVVSPRNLKAGVVEIKGRMDSEAGSVALDAVVGEVRGRLAASIE